MKTLPLNGVGVFQRFMLLFMSILLIVGIMLLLEGCGGGKQTSSIVVVVPGNSDRIQEAIDALPASGGTIFLKAGTRLMNASIHIDRSNVTLIGETGAILALAPGINQPVIQVGSDAQTPINIISNIRIAHLEIDGRKADQTSETMTGKPWIRNNGIDVRMVENLTISDVRVHDTSSGGIVVSWDSWNIAIDTISSYRNKFDGIALYASSGIIVSSFRCWNNEAAGLSLDNAIRSVIFADGVIDNSGDVGIFARQATEITFTSLVISNSQSHGCFLSHNTDISNSGVRRLFFESCSFLDNNGNGIWLASTAGLSPNNAVSTCFFAGNTMEAIRDDSGVLDQQGNTFQ